MDVNGENMIYKVKARVIEETIGEFYRKLADGTVSKQRPDGEEIVASMKRAVLTGPGAAEWYEMCFCPTPLDHERRPNTSQRNHQPPTGKNVMTDAKQTADDVSKADCSRPVGSFLFQNP